MTYAALLFALIATPAPDSESSHIPAGGAATASRGEPVLLNFTTTWCGYCKQMKPTLAQLAQLGYPVRDVDGDENAALAKRYKVTGYPTYVIVDGDGVELARTAGVRPASELAGMYREAQAEVRSRTRLVSNRRDDDRPNDDDNPQAQADESRPARKFKNPHPWESVVRIRMRLSGNSEGVGSGTVIYSTANETIILTCAHIFKEDGQRTPPPSQFRKPIQVDLFDGQPNGPKRNQVHFVETVTGECIDYDLTNDVGLIRIRPGKVLPASRVVPPHWAPEVGMGMTTVGCSEGKDATAWTTKILRTNARLKNTGSGETFYVTECEHPPKQGRSGGGLFTDDGYVAGVCDFADPQHGHGLYAVPNSIYKLLDRNKLIALYDPKVRDRDRDKNEPKRLLADKDANPKRPKSEGTLRTQSPEEEDLSVPPPSRFGIRPPVIVENDIPPDSSASSKSTRGAWSKPTAKMTSNRRPESAEVVTVPSRMTLDGNADPAEETETVKPPATQPTPDDDAPVQKGSPTWKPVRRE